MHAKFIDRIAQRICAVNRKDGQKAASRLAHRLMGKYPKESPEWIQVRERILYWRNKPLSDGS